MASQDLRTDVAQLIQKSDLDEQQKQKMLFALPKMADDEVQKLAAELQKIEDEEAQAIHQKIEREVALEELADDFGGQPEELMSDEEAQAITDEILDQISQHPEKLTELLIALGPKELKKLEKAVEKMGDDPSTEFSQEAIQDTVQKLRDFSVQVSKASHEIDEELQEQLLEEELRLEKEKQAILNEYLHDLELVSESA